MKKCFSKRTLFKSTLYWAHSFWSALIFELLELTLNNLGDSAWNHLLSSFCAGLCACLASSPVDVVRTRLMDQRKLLKGHQQIYKSSLDCGWSTLKSEGLSGLYRGFVPSFMRMGPWNIIFFLVYEQLKASFWPSSAITYASYLSRAAVSGWSALKLKKYYDTSCFKRCWKIYKDSFTIWF